MSEKNHKCEHCAYSGKYKNRLEIHMWNKHDINTDNKFKIFECDLCNFVTKHNTCLGLHKWITHDINTDGKYKLHECAKCDYKTKHPGHIKDHIKKRHTKNEAKQYNCSICSFTSKYLSNLDLHNWTDHNINKNGRYKIHQCSKCTYHSKIKGSLEKHLWQSHGINVDGKFKMYQCEHCESEFKNNRKLERHLWTNHNINTDGKFKMHKCVHCELEFKTTCKLNRHLWTNHNINTNGKFKTHKCEHCEYEFKTNDDLKRHQENVHDIGNKVCQYCTGNCFRLRLYKDKNTGQVKICSKCYKKATGYTCRAEEDMVNHLRNHEILSKYIVLTDKIVANDSCNTKRRPDTLMSSGDMHIIVECDEKQHRHYNPSCESGRIDEILDEFKSGQVVFIRWNPDHYKTNKKLNRKDRLKKLEKTIINITKNPPVEYIKVIYMFYDHDNPVIVDRWTKEFIY